MPRTQPESIVRRQNRELSLFGMSSLDLFASALGAFILISIIIFPLIADSSRSEPAEPIPLLAMAPCPEPIVCPVCPSFPALPAPVACPAVPAPSPAPVPIAPPAAPVAVPEPVACPVCEPAACPVCPTVPAPVPCPDPGPAPPTATYQLPHLDLVLALDITSSMAPQVAALKAEVSQLSDLLSRMTPSFAIGLVAFGDRLWERPTTTFTLRRISGPTLQRAAFRGFVSNLSVRMGLGRGSNNDPPEAFLQALTESARMPWRPESERKVIVLVTDHPAYPEEINRTIATAAAIARIPGHRVSTVYINSQGVGDPQVESFLQSVANAGRGQFVRDVGGSLTVNLLLSLL